MFLFDGGEVRAGAVWTLRPSGYSGQPGRIAYLSSPAPDGLRRLSSESCKRTGIWQDIE